MAIILIVLIASRYHRFERGFAFQMEEIYKIQNQMIEK